MSGVSTFDPGAAALAPGKERGQLRLHHVEGFVDGHLRAALDHRAPLRKLRRRVERWGFDDAVTRRTLAHRPFRDRAVRFDLVDRARERVAWVDDRGTQLAEPRRPLLHHTRLLRRGRGHVAAVIDQEISHRFVLLTTFDRNALINARAALSR